MDKINLEENYLNKKLTKEETIKNFYAQILRESHKRSFFQKLTGAKSLDENMIKYKSEQIEIKERSVDPRGWKIYVYVICSQEVIDKLLSFEKEYVSYKKEIKKIDELERHSSMEFEIYNITYNEYKEVKIRAVKDVAGAHLVKDILIAEDDIEFARKKLDYIDVKF